MTMIRSAIRTVENRWEIRIAILPTVSSWKRRKISYSVSASSEAVGSSKTSISASLMKARAKADVLTGRQVIAHEILKDNADYLSEVQRVQFFYVDAVDKYPALGWIVKAAQEFDQGCFAGTVGPHQRDLFTRGDAQIDIT